MQYNRNLVRKKKHLLFLLVQPDLQPEDQILKSNYKTKKLVDRAEKQEELLTNIDLSLRNIGNLLVQINEKFFEKVRNND